MSHTFSAWDDTIVALATPPGIGAIGIIRLSGENSIAIADALFTGKNLSDQASHTLHVGMLKNDKEELDEVVVSLYKAPKSYTGENIAEISCHGSPFIQQQIIAACIQKGARLAKPGEFTQRAFLNGKMDLTQAEAVADVIAAHSLAAKQTALKQLRGGFSFDLKALRGQLIGFAALIELELDFSQEDVEFADRLQLERLIAQLMVSATQLLHSFRLGNVIKNGVNVAIIGKPNAGKSTLLNALLNEERAIVSDIAGTTRDTIEEVLNINGVLFRLIDTAGIREHATDRIEKLGIERSRHNAEKADIIIHLADLTDNDRSGISWLKPYSEKVIEVYNKYDQVSSANLPANAPGADPALGIYISAKNKEGIETLKSVMYERAIGETIQTEHTIVTNARHFAALQKVLECLNDIKAGMDNNLTGDFLALDIRRCLHYLGEITGQVEIDRDILGTIFGKFCIGK
ncbi:tRNA uridine-5-carboxymethylaminomethyl(34) synthesis GTPase MnmE [Agriterribacter sp.]|uniref:tRNA uridine-5-carboxymethylaminomethyl(34) synthesis GTPase MnmE n=1 Tax=Agriterribacter sp. TaxID=2821509 RepID=UPI002C8B8460|nr:tRNA uridine-5-carboxymethylaminomethyl(34) synthesis GTPase MnmE [Agriterribacter sp.]HTN06707.1 tRNA uridine-5-carboxymethylaminomethyl(34) synthesis GTPase MnmE [Agriterribacter sp.]